MDRLRVFVSSAIGECAAERAAARRAITSLNLEPVLFEELGARPYPPRELYRARLEDSQIVVAIYRVSYGWVAPGMQVSGVEDEFLLASGLGVDRLVYVYSDARGRDPRLQGVIEKAKASVTFASYSDPEELEARIRDDIAEVISARFRAQLPMGAAPDRPEDALSALVPSAQVRLRRADLEAEVLATIETHGRAFVEGPIGSGKSVLLAQLASANDWLYVDAKGLSESDAIGRCANTVRAALGESSATFPDLRAARHHLEAAWGRLQGGALVVDGLTDALSLLALPRRGSALGGPGLLLSAVGDVAVSSVERVVIPPLSVTEVQRLAFAVRGEAISDSVANELWRKSAGSPLYLRYYLATDMTRAEATLQDLELAAFASLQAEVREAVAYVTLAGRPLGTHDLAQLLGVPQPGAERVGAYLLAAKTLVRQSPGAVDIVHGHLRETLLNEIARNPAKHGFLASRLGAHLEEGEDYVTAFHVFDRAGDDRAVERILADASSQASKRGGGRPAITILRRVVDRAHLEGDRDRECQTRIALAQTFAQVGDASSANAELKLAAELATVDPSGRLSLFVRECELGIALDQEGGVPNLALLDDLHSRYETAGMAFEAARVLLQLSVEHVTRGDFEAAASAATKARVAFQALGDSYGLRLAELNLMSAISALPHRAEEARELAERVSLEIDADSAPRERAIVCNLMTRRLRATGSLVEAEKFAREAIAIGESLSDSRVIAINRINLGNVLRDDGRTAEALQEYRNADRVAAAGKLVHQEAAANELIASVLSELGDSKAALIHAHHAVGMSRAASDDEILARALEELAIALRSLGRTEEAVHAFTAAASALARRGRRGGHFATMLSTALQLCHEAKRAELLVPILGQAVSGAETPVAASAKRGSVDIAELCVGLADLSSCLEPALLVSTVATALSGLLESVPAPIEGRVLGRLVEALVARGAVVPPVNVSATVCGALLACDLKNLDLYTVTSVAQDVAALLENVAFRCQEDGAAHWIVSLRGGQTLVCSLTQLDDSAVVAGASMAAILLLLSLEPLIRRELLGAEAMPRTEVQIQYVSHVEFQRHVPASLSGLDDVLESEFALAQSSDFVAAEQPPVVCILRDDFGRRWRPREAKLSPSQMLVARLLGLMTSHFFAREVSADEVGPKIVGVMRRSMSRVQVEPSASDPRG